MNYYNGNGYDNRQSGRKTPRKSDIERCLVMMCGANPANVKIVRLSDKCDGGLRHSCAKTGICVVDMRKVNILGYPVDYFYYPCCNKIVYYIDII